MSSTDSKIYTAICSIIGEIGAISKSKKASAGNANYMYRGIDDVMNALQPMLAKYHVFVVPTVLEQYREDKITKAGGNSYLSIFKIKFTFYADDGSFVEAVTVGESADTGDKGSNKAMAIAFKYALFQVFCIPTEEMPDPDAETPPETVSKANAPTPTPQPQKPPEDKNHWLKVIQHHIYPNATKDSKGDTDGYCYEIYTKALTAYNKLDPKVKSLTDLSIDKLKDMAQQMEVPPVLG